MDATEVVVWPAVRDAMAVLQVSQVWVLRLIAQGELRAVRTRLGWLVDPESLEAVRAARVARKAAKEGAA